MAFIQRRAIALNAVAVARLQSRTLTARLRSHPAAAFQLRAYTSTSPRRQHVFHSQLESNPDAAAILSAQKPAAPANPQTLTEKIVQRFSVGLSPGKKVKAGDYVTISPHHCMTHDNTWPVSILNS